VIKGNCGCSMGNTCRGSFKGILHQGYNQPDEQSTATASNSKRHASSDHSNSEHSFSSLTSQELTPKKDSNLPLISPTKKDTIMRRSVDNQAYYVLGHKTPNIRDLYTLGRKLGQGQFGTTYLCTEILTGMDYACKSICKRKLISKEDVEDVRREIQIMHHLAGHKNIVTIKGAYEDPLYVHIVMELCSGGELFDRIIQRGHYSERKAAELTKIIVGVVEACHSLGVMHRDLKPENFLLVNKDDDFSLKAIDFGLSVFFKPGIQHIVCILLNYQHIKILKMFVKKNIKILKYECYFIHLFFYEMFLPIRLHVLLINNSSHLKFCTFSCA